MLVPLGTVTVLMVVMTTKHLLADFLLQTAAMAKGKAAEHAWLGPLLLHAGAHASLTLLIALAFAPAVWWVAPLELVIHAVLDRGKAIVSRRARVDPGQDLYWWLFGTDQFLHQLTNIGLVFIFVTAAFRPA